MKLSRIVLVLGFLSSVPAWSVPAVAQMMPSIPLGGGSETTPEEREKMRAQEEAARNAAARIPARQKASNDPWAGARDVTPAPASPAMSLNPKKKK